MDRNLFLIVCILCNFIMCLYIFWGDILSTCFECSHPISSWLKISLSASFPEDLELNRDFNGDDYECEDEAKLVIFPDHFEIPLPNIEELPALVSESVCALHAKGLICLSVSVLVCQTSRHYIWFCLQMTLFFINSLFMLLSVCSDVMWCSSYMSFSFVLLFHFFTFFFN